MLTYTVKNVKSFQGREGTGYECSLYKDGKRIGKVTDTADGGEADFYLNKGEIEILEAHCKTLPKEPCQFDKTLEIEIDPYIFVERLVDKYEKRANIKKWCRTKIVFRLDGDSVGRYRTMKGKYTQKIGDALRANHHGQGLIIYNETI